MGAAAASRGKALRWRGSSRVAASSICIHTAKLEIMEAMAAPSPNGRKHRRST